MQLRRLQHVRPLRLVRWEGYDFLSWEVDVWVWGLPPPCRIPASEVEIETDAGLVLEAAGRAASVWPAMELDEDSER